MKLNLWKAIVILIVSAVVFSGIQVAVVAVKVSSLPASLQPIWDVIVYVFSLPSAIIAFTFLRNILGYVENTFQTEPAGQKIQYEAKELYATMSRFTVYVGSMTTLIQSLAVGTPYQQYATLIAGATGTILDMILKAINDLAKK